MPGKKTTKATLSLVTSFDTSAFTSADVECDFNDGTKQKFDKSQRALVGDYGRNVKLDIDWHDPNPGVELLSAEMTFQILSGANSSPFETADLVIANPNGIKQGNLAKPKFANKGIWKWSMEIVARDAAGNTKTLAIDPEMDVGNES